jgi:hypothetical protein
MKDFGYCCLWCNAANTDHWAVRSSMWGLVEHAILSSWRCIMSTRVWGMSSEMSCVYESSGERKCWWSVMAKGHLLPLVM